MLAAALQPCPFASDLGESIADLASVDADVLQLPVAEIAQRGKGRLARATRDDICNPAIDQSAEQDPQLDLAGK